MTLIPHDLLKRSDKILFVTHLAIGDYTYLQSCFKALSQVYPHLKIHLWVDETRRTRCFWRWKHLKKYALYDWLEQCPFIDMVYKQTYRPALLRASLKQARGQRYPIVVSLATLRPHRYARYARAMSPHGFVVGMRPKTKMYQVIQNLAFRSLDAGIDARPTSAQGMHISSIYAAWFTALFDIQISDEQRFPFVTIPNKWMAFAKLRFLKWGINKKNNKFMKVFFINPYAKINKRSWSLQQVEQLVRTLKQQDQWGDVRIIVNVVPEQMARAKKFFDVCSFTNTYLFTASHNFFQLPAMMSICDIVISVETAVMHLANAVHVPVIALMRQKNPEWAPLDTNNSFLIMTPRRQDWVEAITVDQVLAKLTEVTQCPCPSPSSVDTRPRAF